jgi:hypothetical protein
VTRWRFAVAGFVATAAGVALFCSRDRAPTAAAPAPIDRPTARASALSTQPDRASARVAAAKRTGPARVDELQLVGIRGLLEQMRQLSPADREREDALRQTLQEFLATENPEAIVRELTPEEAASEFGAEAFSRWAGRDAVAAGQWLFSQPNPTPEQIRGLASALLDDATKSGNADAIVRRVDGFLSRMDGGPARDALLAATAMATQLARPEAAAALASRISDEDLRARALASLTDDWARHDSVQAGEWLDGITSSPLRDHLIAVGASAQASADPMAAIDWVLARPGSDATATTALRALAGTWRTYAPERADALSATVKSVSAPP